MQVHETAEAVQWAEVIMIAVPDMKQTSDLRSYKRHRAKYRNQTIVPYILKVLSLESVALSFSSLLWLLASRTKRMSSCISFYHEATANVSSSRLPILYKVVTEKLVHTQLPFKLCVCTH